MGFTRRHTEHLSERLSALAHPSNDRRHLANVDTWTQGERPGAGTRFSLGDLIVGILAADIGALVWSLDRDFERMEKLKLIQLYG